MRRRVQTTPPVAPVEGERRGKGRRKKKKETHLLPNPFSAEEEGEKGGGGKKVYMRGGEKKGIGFAWSYPPSRLVSPRGEGRGGGGGGGRVGEGGEGGRGKKKTSCISSSNFVPNFVVSEKGRREKKKKKGCNPARVGSPPWSYHE